MGIILRHGTVIASSDDSLLMQFSDLASVQQFDVGSRTASFEVRAALVPVTLPPVALGQLLFSEHGWPIGVVTRMSHHTHVGLLSQVDLTLQLQGGFLI